MRFVVGIVAICVSGAAIGQAPVPLGESAKRVIGNWEFSDAERDRTCTVTLKSDPTPAGLKIEFDPNCANLFPLVRDAVASRCVQLAHD